MFSIFKDHVFDKIAKLEDHKVNMTLTMLEQGFTSKDLMHSSPSSQFIFTILFAALNAYLKSGLNCNAFSCNSNIEFKFSTELWINTVMYQNVGTDVVEETIKVFKNQAWHDVKIICFLDHLYRNLVLDGFLQNLVTSNKNEVALKESLQLVLGNLFTKYNIPRKPNMVSSKVTIPRLKQMASDLGIKGISNMRKETLIQRIKNNGNYNCSRTLQK